jgi:hypothetical protein
MKTFIEKLKSKFRPTLSDKSLVDVAATELISDRSLVIAEQEKWDLSSPQESSHYSLATNLGLTPSIICTHQTIPTDQRALKSIIKVPGCRLCW